MKRLVIEFEKLKGALHRRQRAVAIAMRMHEGTLHRKLKGDSSFTLDELNQVAEILQRNTMEFLKEVEINEQNGG